MASVNARVSAAGLIAGSAATLAVGFAPELVPLSFVALGLWVFGAWGFADEMGVRKPLNRAGLVALVFAAVARILVLLDVGNSVVSGSLLYAFALLLALLFWSMAFLHRDGRLKIAGAVGASATIIPILALIAGHVFVGVGAYWGIGSLYGGLSSPMTDTPRIITIIEVVLVVWSLIAGTALWTGKIENSPAQ
ncbi:MAG: hypothetical protein GY717_00365 [Rhodobacteraceae bacterium]|nr:hypothetical protein [Paracoccaceae bacterium]